MAFCGVNLYIFFNLLAHKTKNETISVKKILLNTLKIL